jgi:glycosyltransferase involved in cell wall biosynthesis
VFVGKLIDRKRPLELLDAYARAGLAGRAQLLYVGDGALREPLEARAREANLRGVRVLGFLNQTRIPLAYALGDVLCLLSDARETWGLVVNEALACGRPVIVSAAVGCADDLVDAENGWVVPLDDPVALAATLRAALAARDAWPEMGRRGRRRVAAHTYEAMAAGLETAIDVAAGAGR